MNATRITIASEEEQQLSLASAAHTLREGGIICLPTDTVYGLAVDAEHDEAVRRLYRLKKRPRNKPLVLFLPMHTSLFYLVETLPPLALKLIARFWPGPLTLVLPSFLRQPACLVQSTGTIGLRIPDNAIASTLARLHGLFLATTSANLSEHTPARCPQDLSPMLEQQIDLVIDDGGRGGGQVSTVVTVAASTLQLLRKGAISNKKLQAVQQKPLNVLFICTANLCRSIIAQALFAELVHTKGKACRVLSAGTSVFRPGAPLPAVAEALCKRGLARPLPAATPLSASLVGSADLILVMEQRHKQHLLERFPQAMYKTWLLKEFTRGTREEIADPISFTHVSNKQVVDELETELAIAGERIFG